MKRITIFLTMIFIAFNLTAQTANEIITRMDNAESFTTMMMDGEMISTDRFGDIRSTFTSWSRDDDFLIEFTNIEELGQKVLRLENTIYLYDPDAEDVLRLKGAALKQSMFGDVSYEDMTEGSQTLDQYDATLLGSEIIDGTDCFIVELVAKVRDVAYYKQVLWIGKNDYVVRKIQYFSRQKLLKEMFVLDIQQIGQKFVITHMIIEDRIRQNAKTELIISNLQADIELDNRLFSVEGLY